MKRRGPRNFLPARWHCCTTERNRQPSMNEEWGGENGKNSQWVVQHPANTQSCHLRRQWREWKRK